MTYTYDQAVADLGIVLEKKAKNRPRANGCFNLED